MALSIEETYAANLRLRPAPPKRIVSQPISESNRGRYAGQTHLSKQPFFWAKRVLPVNAW